MSGSGRAGNGRGNNRKRLFRHREKELDPRQESNAPGGSAAYSNDNTRNDYSQRAVQEKRPFNRGNQNSFQQGGSRPKGAENAQNRQNRGFHKKNNETSPAEKTPFIERPKWVPPIMNSDPLPVPTCPWCSKPIRDLSSAMADKESGVPVHFDCVAATITKGEVLEKGDTVSYIGAGRFGIVNFGGPDNSEIKIKKIIEWENKDNRADWRTQVCDHYSVT